MTASSMAIAHSPAPPLAVAAPVQAMGLGDLVADPDHGIERVFRVLHDQADLPATNVQHLLLGGAQEIDVAKAQPVGSGFGGRRQEAHHGAAGDALAGADSPTMPTFSRPTSKETPRTALTTPGACGSSRADRRPEGGARAWRLLSAAGGLEDVAQGYPACSCCKVTTQRLHGSGLRISAGDPTGNPVGPEKMAIRTGPRMVGVRAGIA
ncbi:MAG: hypothetical protein R3D28_15250 [Geminicoccaceae bacterium]